jgi:hypothetical protein
MISPIIIPTTQNIAGKMYNPGEVSTGKGLLPNRSALIKTMAIQTK